MQSKMSAYFSKKKWLYLVLSILMYATFQVMVLLKEEQFKPEIVTATIELELNDRIKYIDSVFNTDAQKRNAVDIPNLYHKNIGIYKYKNNKIISWNTNAYNASEVLSWNEEKNSSITNFSNYWVNTKKRTDYLTRPDGRIDTITYHYIIPIYQKDNNDIVFLLNEELNENINFADLSIEATPSINAFTITNRFKNTPAFYITFKDTTFVKSSIFLNALFVGAIMFSILWAYVFGLYLKFKYNNISISLIFVIAAQILLNQLYTSPIFTPEILRDSGFFSPALLSSSYGYTNLFELLFTLLSCLCVAIFILRVLIDNKNTLINTDNRIINRFANAIISMSIIYFVFTLHYKVTSTLVFDSKIPLVTDSFFYINWYTIWGLFIILICNIIVLVFTNILWIYALKVWHNQSFIKFLFFLCSTVVCAFLYKPEIEETLISNLFFTNICILLFSKMDLPILEKQKYKNIYISWQIWILLIACICTFQLLVLNSRKEIELRKTYIESLNKTNDILLEYTLTNNLRNAINDSIIIKELVSNSVLQNNKLSNYIQNNYFKNIGSNYAIDISFHNNVGENLDTNKSAPNINTNSLDSTKLYEILFEEAQENSIFYKIHLKYQNFIIVVTLSEKNHTKYKNFDYYYDNSINRTDDQFFSNYSIAYYKAGRIVKKYDKEFFSYQLDPKITESPLLYIEKNNLKYSELYYKVPNSDYVILISYKRNLFVSAITTFSFLTVVLALVYINYLIIRHILIYSKKIRNTFKFSHLSINARINVTIWGTVLLSFGILGAFTIYLLRNNGIDTYEENNHSKIGIIKSVLSYNDNKENIKSSLEKLAQDFQYQVIIYDSSGIQLPILKNPDVQLKNNIDLIDFKVLELLKRNPSLILESTSKLGFINLNCVTTSLEINNNLYVARVFDLSSKNSSKDNIADMILVMLNTYIMIIALTSIIVFLITRSATKPIELIVSKFKKVSLKHNELIDWPYKDEFGLLVHEYNTMIQKVEKLASKIAVQERENVWREMAQQVAHEIKNPLTPMKLNVQYLKRAIEDKRDNVEELTERVCNILVEQIDNLTHIATEFSAFAKLPVAEPEAINVVIKILSLVKLFEVDERVTIEFRYEKSDLYVYIDNSYFIRAITNVIKNGIQAVPKDKQAVITISAIKVYTSVLITIEDNGMGIPKEIIDKMFMPYFTSKSSGTGIGLSMTKNMIEVSNGTITFETEENKGTTFYITLPISKK